MKQGLGSVWQRRNGRWAWQEEAGTDPVTGTRIRLTAERATREAVLAARLEILAAHATKPSPEPAPDPGTVAEWVDHWLRTIVQPKRAAATYVNCEGACRNHILPILGDRPLASITTADVEALMAGKPQGTREMIRKVFGACWRDAWQDGRVTDRDVVRRVPLRETSVAEQVATTRQDAEAALLASMATPAKVVREGMRAQDLEAVLRAVEGDRLRARWMLGLVFGGRQSEVLGFAWPDLTVTGDGGTLALRRSRNRQAWAHGCHEFAPCGRTPGKCPARTWLSPYKAPKTEDSVRTLALSTPTVAALQDWRARQALELAKLQELPAVPWMFTNPDGTPIQHSSDQAAWQRILAQAGVSRHYSLHHMRHTAATEAASSDIDLPTLMAMFGWTKRETVEIYAHTRDDRLKDAWAAQQQRFLGTD